MKKLTIAGNALADVIKRIDAYPSPGMLCKIGEIVRGVGGSVPNTGIDLKTLDPQGIEVKAIARLGKDENGDFIKKVLSSRGMDISGITECLSCPLISRAALPPIPFSFISQPPARCPSWRSRASAGERAGSACRRWSWRASCRDRRHARPSEGRGSTRAA